MNKTMKLIMEKMQVASVVLSAMLACPLGVSAQSVRGDCDYDGDLDISDLTLLINHVLNDEWNDQLPNVQRDTIMVNNVPLVMVHVEGGSYAMGTGITATVADFSIGQTEVTNELWKAVMGGTSPNYFITRYYPVHDVGLAKCQEFITKLNEMTGLQFRLPRTTEWEWAARGGKLSRGYTFAGAQILDLVGWYNVNSSTSLRQVACLYPNELGLYDMSGNLREYCIDAFTGGYSDRGGSYLDDPEDCMIIRQNNATTLASGQSGTMIRGSVQYGLRLAL